MVVHSLFCARRVAGFVGYRVDQVATAEPALICLDYPSIIMLAFRVA